MDGPRWKRRGPFCNSDMLSSVFPAKAGIQEVGRVRLSKRQCAWLWAPAFAGETEKDRERENKGEAVNNLATAGPFVRIHKEV